MSRGYVRRIGPGITYVSDPRGLAEFGRSNALSSAMVSVARDMASQANSQGYGTYEARPRTVTAGWNAEDRSGAEVVEVERDYRDYGKRILTNLSKSYRMRGGN